MTRAGHHPIAIALLLLAFVSQSVAALMMSCQHNAKSASAMVEMHHPMAGMAEMAHTAEIAPTAELESMDHSLHMHHPDPSPTPQKTDCCKSFGHCSAGGCSLALGSEAVIVFSALHSSISDLYNSSLPSAFTTSLFRPPIFR